MVTLVPQSPCLATSVRPSLCRARTRALSLSWCFLQSLGCSAVLADQAMDDLSALDRGVHIDRLAELVQRRSSAAEGGLQGVFGVVAGEQEVALSGHEVRGGTRDCGGEDPAGLRGYQTVVLAVPDREGHLDQAERHALLRRFGYKQ